VWVKELADGSRAVGVFNLGGAVASYDLNHSAQGLDGKRLLRDVWRQKDLGIAHGHHALRVAPHGVVLLTVRNPRPQSSSANPGPSVLAARLAGPRH
jgi:alpha-galactosidase